MKRLNKFLKKQLINTLLFNKVSVNTVGNNNLWIIIVKNKHGILFEYKSANGMDTVMVGKDIVATDTADNLHQDMQDLLNVLHNQIERQREMERIEKDRQNMTDEENRAIYRLKQYTR